MRIPRVSVCTVVMLAASVAGASSPLTDQQKSQPPRPQAPTMTTRHGPCDASAAVAVGPHTFIVANDEDNVLRVYGPADAEPQPDAFDLSAFLGLEADGRASWGECGAAGGGGPTPIVMSTSDFGR
jgi:hypothetical protein